MDYLKFLFILLFSTQLQAGYVNDVSAKLVDSNGTALDSLNSGSGLNALNVAIAGTNYVVSTNNSSSANLAAGATFTGAIDNTFNQQALSYLVISDQPGTLTIKQYSDAAGTLKVPDITITHAAGGTSGSVTLNGNYVKLVYKNTGFATTSSFKLDAAYGTIPATTAIGNGPVSLNEIGGVSVTPRGDGTLKAQIDPVSKFYDPFETVPLDTTNYWTVGGTTVPSAAGGTLSISPGSAANATSYLKSIPTFLPGSNAFLQLADLVQLEAAALPNSVRFWGLGVLPATPSATIPISNGAIFETLASDGSLWATTWSNSVRTNAVQITRPSDGLVHRYAIYYKASIVFYEVDGIKIAQISLPNPAISTFSLIAGSLNSSTAPASAPVLNAALIGLADTGRNSSQIADGTFPWRTAKINSDGSLVTTLVDGYKSTYSASVSSLVLATTPTDIFTITGSATKVIHIKKIGISGTQTTSQQRTVLLVKRSTADVGGTSITQTAVPLDSNNPAATATVRSYSANPTTLGTSLGTIASMFLPVDNPTGGVNTLMTSDYREIMLGTNSSQSVTLRNANEMLSINMNSVSSAGSSFNIFIEWTEE